MMKWRLPCRSVLNSILPPLISVTALATSGVTVPVFGFGIRPRGPSTRPRRPTLPIMVGGGDDRVEVEEPALDALDHVVGADEVGTGRAGLLGPVTGGEDQHPGGLAGAVRQVDGAADHLVLLAGVDAQPQGDLDGRVELRHLLRLGEGDRFGRAVELRPVDLLVGLAVGLAALHTGVS